MRQGFRLNHWCWCVLAKHRCVCFSNCAAPTRNANNLNTRNFSSQIFPTLSPNVWPQFCYRQRQRMDVPYFSSLQQSAVASKILCLIFFLSILPTSVAAWKRVGEGVTFLESIGEWPEPNSVEHFPFFTRHGATHIRTSHQIEKGRCYTTCHTGILQFHFIYRDRDENIYIYRENSIP